MRASPSVVKVIRDKKEDENELDCFQRIKLGSSSVGRVGKH